jgi:hypothetical protein
LSIELIKFLAVIFVTNSHFGDLYVNFKMLATGGAIGDVLFFFASGFTLFLGRFGRFDNWYKRRIKRIYPSILAWAIIMSFWGLRQYTLKSVILGGDFWFIRCIMLYYIVLYFVRFYYSTKPMIPFIVVVTTILIWYYFEDSSFFFMYNATYFKWIHYFLFMLLGAYIGNKTIQLEIKPKSDLLLLFLTLVLFYATMLLSDQNSTLAHFQIISLIPLFGFVLFTYKVCCISSIVKFLKTKLGFCFRFIAGLCLEVYIVQIIIIRNEQLLNFLLPLFPLNLFITFFIIIVCAYFLRCMARAFSQLFEKEDFDWNKVFRPVD